MAPISFTLLTILILLSTPIISSSTAKSHHHHRRILHQPFFPQITEPPLQPPQSQPQQQKHQLPKYPFSSLSPPNTPKNPFFPFYASPPPPKPPSTAQATFPANISSLILPQTSHPSKPISKKLVAVAVSLSLLSAALVTAVAAFLLHHRRHSSFTSSIHDSKSDKTPRADSIRLFPPNTTASDSDGGGGHKPPRPPSRSASAASSTEFLYLGTLSGINEDITHKKYPSDSSNATTNSSMLPAYQKLGSPELRPLPPLPRLQIFRRSVSNEENQENEEEEFFSPRSSSGRKESPKRVFLSVGSEENNSRSASNISHPSSSNSASPSNYSMSSSPFIPLNLISPTRPKPKAVDFFPAPSRPPPPIPNQQAFSENTQNTPASDSCEDSESTQNTPVIRDYSNVVRTVQGKLPPTPPPLPPPGFWEARDGPPVLVTPSRPVAFRNLEMGEGGGSDLVGSVERSEETVKPKLKALHWDKVRASSDRAMVWDHLKSSSFQLDEEMIETLFMVNSSSLTPKDNSRPTMLNQENRVLDPKKSQNIAILLRALNVTIDEVCEALLEGNADTLGTELLESLLKMAPTKEEERNLKEFKDESPVKLGPAEKFLKAVLDIPFAFQRVDAMLYIANFDSEVEYLKRSFETLEAACEELRKSRMFLKLLEAVLKTGNRMNVGTTRGDAHAFKLDTLLKLVDIKGTDGKTTLLHFVVQEISRAEGSHISGVNEVTPPDENPQSDFPNDIEFRKIGLQVVSSLGGELTNVKKAAAMDSDVLSTEVTKLALGSSKIKVVLKLVEEGVLKESSTRNFVGSMNEFLKKAESEIVKVQAQESAALSVVKELTEYFHGNSAKEEAHPFRIFMVVRDFLSILDQVCKDVGKINERSTVSSARPFPQPVSSSLPPVFPGFIRRRHDGSSDDES
ncbi:hypothetical protein RHGRI_025411 [Rhododendron griersonianum]|uniref:Formin-like protein n=1 Tax=Rhododendron griersonianum TaxID=479676 RepID=A0AAV6ITI0_9ERIC|nr:hypothetical protein RHGRI_025411 [Rhododendron griersonianum]